MGSFIRRVYMALVCVGDLVIRYWHNGVIKPVSWMAAEGELIWLYRDGLLLQV